MPTLTRWYVKSALAYLVAALLVGAMLAARSVWLLPAFLGGFGPVYFHLFMVGWVTQLIFGIVFWLFPKFSKEQPRGREWLGWAVFGLLNAGLLLRVISEPANAQAPGGVWGWLLLLSAGLQWLAGLGFVANTWPRVHGGPRRV
ncbi:MAG: cbb3-type cytochrome c oxidase subunit I [Chloroflexi bacterium]|nr:cbb3-type cytochrome c oxidase subunit I [Chloroflexota bacterium]MCI0577828.1 cbb3-type cytochrome c oxidase subunit I [Chloroflexota bacterium]MCI0646125.1 cbb3-type cytochrome c oxidase subunit I [Chloroflexota bacterium]MCI0731688.1 cbb3-type cytochrome c oxidase subunit I [Chloroflexota bacterium]